VGVDPAGRGGVPDDRMLLRLHLLPVLPLLRLLLGHSRCAVLLLSKQRLLPCQ